MDDLIEVHFRLGELTGMVNRQKIQGAIIVAILAGAVCLLSFSSIKDQWFGFLIFSLFSCFAVVVMVPYGYRRELRKLIKKTYGSNGPFDSEFKLTEEGIVFTNQYHSMTFKWSVFVKLNETDKFIDLITFPLGMVRLQKKYFNEHELNEWKSYIFAHVPSLNPSSA